MKRTPEDLPAATEAMGRRWDLWRLLLNEPQRRLWAGIESMALGPDGDRLVALGTGMAGQTVKRGREELETLLANGDFGPVLLDRKLYQREEGGGRKSQAPGMRQQLVDRMEVQRMTSGSRDVVLRWSCADLRTLADGIASHTHVSTLLSQAGFDAVTELGPRRTLSGEDKSVQCRRVASAAVDALGAGRPVLVLTLLKARRSFEQGSLKRAGTPGTVEDILTRAIWGRDNWDEELKGEVLSRQGWAPRAPDVHTAELAAEVIRRWWTTEGHDLHHGCSDMVVVVNALGGTGAPERAWAQALARFAKETGVAVRSCYLPPSVCRWERASNRLGAVVAMDEGAGYVGRHKVVCRVLDHRTFPTVGRKASARRAAQGPVSPSIDLTRSPFGRNDMAAPEAHAHWDFSVSG